MAKTIPAPWKLRSLIEKELMTLGWRIIAREQTSGALKTWFGPNGLGLTTDDLEAIGVALASVTGFRVRHHAAVDTFTGSTLFGGEFEIIDQRPTKDSDGLFLACYRQGPNGVLYASGLDI